MKLVFTFFLLFCFTFLGRNNSVQASAIGFKNIYSQNLKLEKTQQINNASASYNYVINSGGFMEAGDFFLTLDDEDDEDYIQKHLSLISFFLILSLVLITNYGNTRRLAEGNAFSKYLSYMGSYKYIVQRALRI